MPPPRILKTIFYLSLLGTVFANAVTIRGLIAPATTPGIFSCVGLKILGWSPCPYGLTLFTLLLIISGLIISGRLLLSTYYWLLLGVAWLGVAFSAWVGYRELILPGLARGIEYWQNFNPWLVPACVWGFLVFLIVAILTTLIKSSSNSNTQPLP